VNLLTTELLVKLNIQETRLSNVIELPVNKIVRLPPYKLHYFSRTQHRPAHIVLSLCCIHYVQCNNHYSFLVDVVDYPLLFSNVCLQNCPTYIQ